MLEVTGLAGWSLPQSVDCPCTRAVSVSAAASNVGGPSIGGFLLEGDPDTCFQPKWCARDGPVPSNR